jgi:hypothetical protein
VVQWIRDYALHKGGGLKRVGFDRCAFFYFLRLAVFFGFDGLMCEIFRIMSSNRDGCFCSFVFNGKNITKAMLKFKF